MVTANETNKARDAGFIIYYTHKKVSLHYLLSGRGRGLERSLLYPHPHRTQAEEVIPLWALKLEVVTKGLVFPISAGQTDLVEVLENSTLASNIYTFCANEMHFISAYVSVIESLVWPETERNLRNHEVVSNCSLGGRE